MAIACLLAASPAHAQEAQQGAQPEHAEPSAADVEARALFQAGEVAFGQGQLERALDYFQRAYELSQRPELLFNIGNVQERLQNDQAALEAFQGFLEARPDSPNTTFARGRVEAIERRLAAAAEAAQQAQAEEAARPSAAPAGGARDGALDVGAVIGFSFAGAGVVLAATFGALTVVADGNLASSCSPSCTSADVSDMRTFALLTDIGFGAAAAGAVVGVIFLVVGAGSGGGGQEQQVSLAPSVGAGSAGLSVWGRF